MSSLWDKLTGKAKKDKIDSILDQDPEKMRQKIEEMKRKQDALAKITHRDN